MKTLFINGNVINVFSEEIEKTNILIENGKIIGIGNYANDSADEIIDLNGNYVCPGLIDGHIHIESTMLLPSELAKISLAHGTTTIIADPHEIANVCGKDGIDFMIEASKNLPFDVYFMLPSCVPATPFDESFSNLTADELTGFYASPKVLGLAEMMNYVGVVNNDQEIFNKIEDAKYFSKRINGHAPLLSGELLDKYISAGIKDDHECSNLNEALEKLKKGMHIMIRQGTSARNLSALIPLFKKPYSNRCMLVTDDKHPADLLNNGHIDSIIKQSVSLGADVISAIKMATLIPAEYFHLEGYGAIAPSYNADFVVFDNLEDFNVLDVYKNGNKVIENKQTLPFTTPHIKKFLYEKTKSSFNLSPLTESDFIISPKTGSVRIIKTIKNELLTEEIIKPLDFSKANGIDIDSDVIKIAVFERHNGTGHRAVCYINGLTIKDGAIATSVSHDSHNLIIAGANEKDMALAGNTVINAGGGLAVVKNGKVLSLMPLPIAGLMSELSAQEVASQNQALRDSVSALGIEQGIEPFMTTAFISLAVIPHLKITTNGLIDVDKQELVDLFV